MTHNHNSRVRNSTCLYVVHIIRVFTIVEDQRLFVSPKHERLNGNVIEAITLRPNNWRPQNNYSYVLFHFIWYFLHLKLFVVFLYMIFKKILIMRVFDCFIFIFIFILKYNIFFIEHFHYLCVIWGICSI